MAAIINIANLSAFIKSVQDAKKIVSDLTPPMSEIARDWMRTNQLYFTQSPGAFADLSSKGSKTHVRGFGLAKTGEKGGDVAGYKAKKLKKYGFVYPILVASGVLRDSMTKWGDANSLNEILNKSQLILGTKVVAKSGANYPQFLNDGTKKMVGRPFLNVSQISVAKWIKILNAYVVAAVGPSGAPAGTPSESAAAAEKAAAGTVQPIFTQGSTKAASQGAAEATVQTAVKSSSGSGGGSSNTSSPSAKKKKKR